MRNVIFTIDCNSTVYILVINVAIAPNDTHLNANIDVAVVPIEISPVFLHSIHKSLDCFKVDFLKI